jgi:hypothetical protein
MQRISFLPAEGRMKHSYFFHSTPFLFSSYLAPRLIVQDARGFEAFAKMNMVDDAALGRRFAVIIAGGKYQAWNRLGNLVRDAKEIRRVLTSPKVSQNRIFSNLSSEGGNAQNGRFRPFSDPLVPTEKTEGSDSPRIKLFVPGRSHFCCNRNAPIFVDAMKLHLLLLSHANGTKIAS